MGRKKTWIGEEERCAGGDELTKFLLDDDGKGAMEKMGYVAREGRLAGGEWTGR